MKTVLVILSLLISSSVFSQSLENWKYLASDNSGEIYVEKSIWVNEYNNNDRNVWVKWIYNGESEEYSKGIVYTLLKIRIDCATQKFIVLSHIDYASDKVVNAYENTDNDYKHIAPESTIFMIYKETCN